MKASVITVKHSDGREIVFPSLVALSRHIPMSVSKLRTYLNGKTIVTAEEYNELDRMSYEPRNWNHAGKNRRRKA